MEDFLYFQPAIAFQVQELLFNSDTRFVTRMLLRAASASLASGFHVNDSSLNLQKVKSLGLLLPHLSFSAHSLNFPVHFLK